MTPEEFTSDLNLRMEVLGLPTLLSPTPQFVSSQRLTMFGNNAAQMMVVKGAETAKIQSGYESKIGQYEFTRSDRNQDVQIYKVIPKFLDLSRPDIVNPKYTVIYIGTEDGKVGYFDIDSYLELHDGFGYMYKQLNRNKLLEGLVVPKEVKFTTAPNHDDDLYNMGVNAKVAYIPHWATTDDAFKISRSLQKKLTHTVINDVVINIKPDMFPLNLYGTEDVYKAFPDVGDTIRDDGILIGFRKLNEYSMLTDTIAAKLNVAEDFHDEIYRGKAGAKIIDVIIFTNLNEFANIKSNIAFDQLMKYQLMYNQYWRNIIQVYYQVKQEGREITPEFNALVTSCRGWVYNGSGPAFILVNKKEMIEYVYLKIVYAYEREIDKGYKLVGDAGNKGVVSAIAEDEDMPTMEDGTRADIMITGASPFNRLSSGQYYQAFINYASDEVMRQVKQMPADNPMAQFEYILGYIHEIRPVYAKFVRETVKGYELDYLEACKREGIYLVIPPYADSLSQEMILRVAEKYHIKRTPVTYADSDGHGGMKRIKTCTDALIGDLYIRLLGKIPIDQLSAIEFGYQNQFKAPIKSGNQIAKTQSQFGQTPQRYGEDETAILTMSCGTDTTIRFLCTYGNAPAVTDRLQQLLLTAEHPSAIWDLGISTEEMAKQASNIGIFKHMLAVIGYDIQEEETSC